MVAYYAVIQYVPDVNGDERVNIGLLTCGGGVVHGRCLQRWNRVTHFGAPDVRVLQDVYYDVETMVQQSDDPESELRRLCAHWTNAVRITPLRASMLDSLSLLEEMAPRVLREPVPRQRHEYRTQLKAAAVARNALKVGIALRLGKDADRFEYKGTVVQGALFEHHFGASVRNGMLYCAAEGLSFETPDTNMQQKSVDAFINAVTDVREINTDILLGVVAFRPTSKSSAYTAFCKVVKEKSVVVLDDERATQEWAFNTITPYIALHEETHVVLA